MNQALAPNPRTLPNKLTKLSLWQRLRQFQPSRRLIQLFLAWWLLLVVATAFDLTSGFGAQILSATVQPLYYLCALLLALLLALIVSACVLDILMLIAISQASSYQIKRRFPSNLPIYHATDIAVNLSFSPYSNLSNSDNAKAPSSFLTSLLSACYRLGLVKRIRLDIYDDYPDQLLVMDKMPLTLALPLADIKPQGRHESPTDQQTNSVTIEYPVMPVERGTGYFGSAHLRIWSPLHLFKRTVITNAAQTETAHYLRVLADFSGLLSNELSVIFEKSVQAGVQALMKKGQGNDFLDLREYSAGDAIRQIDWKASSRLRKLMSKSYEDDNGQDVVFLLDCGEQMRHQDVYRNDSDIDEAINTAPLDWQGGAAQLDQASRGKYFDNVLNAVLLLSYIANKQSDRVGLMTFGGVDVFLPPKKGSRLIRDMLNETADIKPTIQTSDYVVAAQNLLKNLKKRSVIVLITNTRAEATDELTQAVNLLCRRHKVIFANLMERAIFERLYGDIMPTSMDDALLYHALMDYQRDRLQLAQGLQQKTGAFCLQTTASHLPMLLTQAYLSISRH